MITKWKVYNFKSIRESTELEFAPLTIFAGANSSGKSTFIQSLLLFAQTLAHKVSSRPIVLNGAFASLGQFDDLKSNDSEFDRIEIKCTCLPFIQRNQSDDHRTQMYYRFEYSHLQEITCEIAFDADTSSSKRELYQIQPRLYSTQLSCVFHDAESGDQTSYISILRSASSATEYEKLDQISEKDYQLKFGLPYSVELDEFSTSEVIEDFHTPKLVGSTVQHFLPHRVACEIDTLREEANFITLELLDELRRPFHFRRTVGRYFPLTEEIFQSFETSSEI